MAKVPHMREIWQWRRAIMAGDSAQDIAKASGYSETTVRSYTKDERQKVKKLQKEAKESAEFQELLRQSYFG